MTSAITRTVCVKKINVIVINMNIHIQFELQEELFDRTFDTLKEAIEYLKEVEGMLTYVEGDQGKALELMNF